MAITLNITPGLSFSRNQIVAQFNCPDAINTIGVAEQSQALMSYNPIEDQVLAFAWSWDGVDYSAEFTFKDVPDSDAYEIETGTSDLDYLNGTLVPALLSHPDLAEFFAIDSWESAPNKGFVLTARQPYIGPLSLVITIDAFPHAEQSATQGVAEIRTTDYLASAWLHIAPAYNSAIGDFVRLQEIELFPNKDGLADVDLAEYVDAEFHTPETPTDTTATPIICEQLKRDCMLVFGQKFGDPVERKKQSSTIFTAIKGGITHRDFATRNVAAWIDSVFLTNRHTREIFDDQDDWLFWHHQYKFGTPHHIALQAIIYYTDGSNQLANLWVDTSDDIIFSHTYQFAAGYEKSGVKDIADTAGKTVHKYKLALIAKDTGSPSILATITESAIFYIKPYDHLGVAFQYENTLGGIESWSFIGERVYKGNIAAERYRRPLTVDADEEFAELLSFNEQNQPTIQFSTGPMSQSDAMAFPDFMRARHKWIVVGEHRIPFQIAPGKYATDSENYDADYTREMKFTAILAPSKSVSDLLGLWK